MGFVVAEKTVVENVYVTALWGMCAGFYAVGVVWYWGRRKVDVIAARNPSAALLFLLALWVSIALYLVRDCWNQYESCPAGTTLKPHEDWVWIVNSFTFGGIFSCGVYRALDLIAKFERQRLAIRMQLREDGFFENTNPATAAAAAAGTVAGVSVGPAGTAGVSSSGPAAAAAGSESKSSHTPFAVPTGVPSVDDTDPSGNESNWFQTHIRLIHSWKMKLALTLYALITPIVRIWVRAPYDYDSCLPVDYVMEVVAITQTSCMVLLAWRIRTINETMYISQELKGLGVCCLTYSGPYLVWVNGYPQGGRAPVWQLFTLILIWIIFYVSLYQPIKLSYQRGGGGGADGKSAEYQTLELLPLSDGDASDAVTAPPAGGVPLSPLAKNNPARKPAIKAATSPRAAFGLSPATAAQLPPELSSLTAVLALAPGRKSFAQFLMLEFSVENLLFVLEVDRFRTESLTAFPAGDAAIQSDAAAIQTVRERASAIYYQFVDVAASTQVNLSYTNWKPLRREFGTSKSAAAAAAGGGGAGALPLRRASVSMSAAQKQRTALGAMTVAGGTAVSVMSPTRDVRYYTAIFDSARTEIFHLLSSDSFSRYVTSSHFEALIANLKLAKALAQTAGGGGGAGGSSTSTRPSAGLPAGLTATATTNAAATTPAAGAVTATAMGERKESVSASSSSPAAVAAAANRGTRPSPLLIGLKLERNQVNF